MSIRSKDFDYHYLAKCHDFSDTDLYGFFHSLINTRRAIGDHVFVLCVSDIASIFQIIAQEYYCSSDSYHVRVFCNALNDWSKKYEIDYIFSFFSRHINGLECVCIEVLTVGALDAKEELVEVLRI